MDENRVPVESDGPTGASVVSWAAVISGVAASVATSLTLFALAAGLELGSSGWLRTNSVAVLAAAALIVTQWLSALLGGYIAGRLRTRRVGTHTHEVFFRDSAHGFITWCVATVFMASGLVAATSAVMSAPSRLGVAAASGQPATRIDWQAPRTADADSMAAYVPVPSADGRLVLPDGPGSAAAAERRETACSAAAPGAQEWRIREQPLSPADAYRGERNDAARGALLTALSMMIGAFIASVSAVLGGRRRDLHP
jgi:hypothetical protein